jgi:hypothetical protein
VATVIGGICYVDDYQVIWRGGMGAHPRWADRIGHRTGRIDTPRPAQGHSPDVTGNGGRDGLGPRRVGLTNYLLIAFYGCIDGPRHFGPPQKQLILLTILVSAEGLEPSTP